MVRRTALHALLIDAMKVLDMPVVLLVNMKFLFRNTSKAFLRAAHSCAEGESVLHSDGRRASQITSVVVESGKLLAAQ